MADANTSNAVNGAWVKFRGGFTQKAGAFAVALQLPSSLDGRLWVAPDYGANNRQWKQGERWALYARDQQAYNEAQAAFGQSSSQGGGAGVGGPIAPTSSQPAPTLGGVSFRQQVSPQGLFGGSMGGRDGDFQGLDLLTPKDKQSPGTTPYAIGFDQVNRIGSRCKRNGIAKLLMDRDSVNDGSTATAGIVCTPKADFVASTDFIVYLLPNNTTHAFWFDKTGADTEPQESQDADASTRVDISADTTATEVATRLAGAINGATMGLTAASAVADVTVTAASSGWDWAGMDYVTDTDFTMTSFGVTTGSALNANYRALSLAVMPASGDNPDQMLMAMSDKTIGETSPSLNTFLGLVTQYPRWGKPLTLRGVPGPLLTPSQQAGPVLRVNAAYTNVFDATTQAGIRNHSVQAIMIRYSTVGYPRDIDGKAEGEAIVGSIAGAVLADRSTWHGASQNFDSGTVATGRYYITAWAITTEGISEPSFALWNIT